MATAGLNGLAGCGPDLRNSCNHVHSVHRSQSEGRQVLVERSMEEILVYGERCAAGTPQGSFHRLMNKDRRYPNAPFLRMDPRTDFEVKTRRYGVVRRVTGDEGEQCR
jgi:hypothetical protein